MNNLTEYKKSWNEQFALIKTNLPKEDQFEIEKKRLLEIHSSLHEKSAGRYNHNTYYDMLWENLNESVCRIVSEYTRSYR